MNLHHMYMQQWDLGLQRQMGSDWLVSASYLGNKATHLRSSIEENPAAYIPSASTVSNTNQRRLLYRLNPAAGAYFATITLVDDGVNTNYSALRLSVQHRFSNHFTWLSVYTYSHCLQNAETLANRNSEGANYYQNPYNRNADYASCDSDLRHNFVTSAVYESPRFSNRAVNLLLGNWQLSFLISAHTGFLFNPTTGVDASLTGVGQDRPNVAGNPYIRNTKTLVWLNAAAFVPNAPGSYGDAGYNSLMGLAFFRYGLEPDPVLPGSRAPAVRATLRVLQRAESR